MISLNGSRGEVLEGAVPTLEPEVADEFRTFMDWADETRTLRVRANADIPRDAIQARKFGAQGIGLCRTEHMFFAEDRIPWVQQMILFAPIAKRLRARAHPSRGGAGRRGAGQAGGSEGEDRGEAGGVWPSRSRSWTKRWRKILPFQRDDFYGLLKAMAGLPVTIRTLDPPLHEFLPKREELMVEIARMEERKQGGAELETKRILLKRVEELHEFNPMLGHRGCRLGISYPEITAMQARAIMEAACRLKKEGIEVFPEIMIPLVGHVNEFKTPGGRGAQDRRGGAGVDGGEGPLSRGDDDRGARARR